jgi:hypothetical protein
MHAPSIMSLRKPCPHCGELIASQALVPVAREYSPGWFQLSRGPHTACPKCGGFVVSSMANSPWLLVPIIYGVVLLSALYFETALGDMLLTWWGKLLASLIIAAISWRMASQAELKRESHEG